MQQPGFYQADRACAAQLTRARALGNRPLKAGATRRRVLESFRLLPHPRCLAGGVMLARTDAPCPWCSRGARTVRAPGARPTHRLTEGKTHRGMTLALGALQPDDTPLSLRADGVFGIPGHHELGGGEAVPCLSWPAL